MNVRTLLKSLILPCILLIPLSSSCKDEEKTDYLTLEDVSLTLDVEGKTSFDLDEENKEFSFSSTLNFGGKSINWPNLTFEQTFNITLDVKQENVTVKDSSGKNVSAANIAVANNKLTVSFQKVDGSYNYLSSSSVIVKVKTKLKEGLRNEDLEALKNAGLTQNSVFYTQSANNNIKSNNVTVNLTFEREEVYEVKGDPNNANYPYKLNVVYFVPSDVTINPDYQKRISTILLKHQLFMCDWMEKYGYARRSYGLALDKKGMIDITLVIGKGAKVDYPYTGSAPKMIDEVKAYYEKNNLKFTSEHTLIITAVNERLEEGEKVSDTPFYGYGRWCFALDYPGMAYENMGKGTSASHTATVWIGGMLHELGHGLNMPHVGPTYSQKNDAAYGIPLMGAGNRTYGESPTFLHHSSAAIYNNCQVASLTEKKFYDPTTTGTVKITERKVDGNKFTVKGEFEASKTVTDVIVRFHKAEEAFLGAAEGYTSVAFVVKPTGKTFEATIDIEELKVNNYDYKFGITILLEDGTTKSTANSDIYRQKMVGSVYTLQNLNLDKTGWVVTPSHPLPKDDAISNAPQSLVDNNTTTCLSLVKPGKSYDGIKVPETDQVFVIIDMQKEVEFTTINLSFRLNHSNFLKAQKVSFYGSNDNKTFTPIKEGTQLDITKNNVTVELGKTAKCRYLKMTYDAWDTAQGSTMQFSELGLMNNGL